MPSVQGANEGDRAARIFVWSVWVGLAWWLLHYVNAHAVNMPYYDEWELVPALTGAQPITLEWLWSQHNEHRIFLPRLIYVVLAKFTGCDFRAGMYFNAVVLLACSAALIALVQRRRGNAEATDVVFALLFLNLGQAQTLTNSFQIAFSVIPAVAVPILLLYWQPGRATFRATLTAACCTLLLPLIGGTGIALVPALVVATLLGCWQLFRDGKAWFQVVAPSLVAILATLLTLFYFSNYSRPAKHPASPSIGATLDGTAQFLSVGFGGAAQSLWPASKWGVLVICLTSLAVVGYLVVKRPEQRDQALRLLLFAGALLCLALGTSWARIAFAPGAMFASRYVLLPALFWCAVYLSWELLGQSQLRRFFQLSLCFIAASLLVANYQHGMREGAGFRGLRAAISADIRNGMPVARVAERYHASIFYRGPQALSQHLLALKQAQIGVFTHLNVTPVPPPSVPVD